MTPRLKKHCWFLAVLAAVLAAGCSSGGSSGSSSSSAVALVELRFPDPSGQSGGDELKPPENASLIQQVVLVFDGVPDANTVSAGSVRIRDDRNFPVPGIYRVQGQTVVFTPALPIRSAVQVGEDSWDVGGAGLEPGATYLVEIASGEPGAIRNLGAISAELRERYHHPTKSNAVLASLRTTTDPALFFTGLPVHPLRVVDVSPADGATGVAPFLYTDPGRVFGQNQPFEVTFDGPLAPEEATGQRFRLIDLDDTAQSPAGLALGAFVEILDNRADTSSLRVTPSGILPFGHLLAFEVPREVRHLSSPEEPAAGSSVVAMVEIASAPADTISDAIDQPFAGADLYDESASIADIAAAPAEWNTQDSGYLQAAAAFPGGGELGRFVPADLGEQRELVLDTSSQTFPLFDGSTPDAPPGYVVRGGVFHFTDISIPRNVTIRPRGPNPLILVATGSVVINGSFDLRGRNGTTASTFDSSIFPQPGGNPGVGGGRGGDAHPTVYFPPDQLQIMNMVSPTRGEPGFAPEYVQGLELTQGGGGGLSGVPDDPAIENPEMGCGIGNEKPGEGSHGGGGSFLSKGKRGQDGDGNMTPNPDCTWTDHWPETRLRGGGPGERPFRDADPTNDFLGPRGEVKEVLGGQGGGGGGTMCEGYYCGFKMPWGEDQFSGAWPDVTSDARGGGGGGAGGAVEINALGPIAIGARAAFLAFGGNGGEGELPGTSNDGGGGGGGSGGAVVLKSAESIEVKDGAEFQLYGGGGDRRAGNCTSAGCGGHGILQLQVPFGTKPLVGDSARIVPSESWSDPDNERNPVEFTAVSRGVSRWIDVGRVIERPPEGTNPIFSFQGTDPLGFVITEADGSILDPGSQSLEIDYMGRFDPVNHEYYPGEEPRADWVAPEVTVQVEFQAADAVVEGSKEVDPGSVSDWSPSPAIANGRQFFRFRVTFDLSAGGAPLDVTSRRPAVRNLQVLFKF